MSYTPTTSDNSIQTTRRTVLRGAAVGAGMLAFGGVGTRAFVGRAAATSHSIETLYLTDSGGNNGGNFLTKLYSVELDTPNNRANLSELVDISDTDFDQVDAIAASLDGTTVYMIDKTSRHLGT